MALDTPGLISDLTPFLAAPGATEALCAASWATILRDYTDLIVPPVPGAVQDAAKTAFQSALVGMSVPGAAIAIFDAAFAAYASALAAGMVPPGTPPPALLSLTLAPVFIANAVPGVTHVVAATTIGTAIDLWFRTGLSSASVPWS